MCFCISLASQKVPNVQFSILHLKGFETIISIFPFMFCIEGPCVLSKVHLSMSLTFSEKMEKFRMIVDFESQILALFDTFNFQPKPVLILYPSLENSTTGIAIPCMQIQKRKFWLHIWLIVTYLLTLVLER